MRVQESSSHRTCIYKLLNTLNMTTKIIAGLVVVALLAGGGFFLWKQNVDKATPPTPPQDELPRGPQLNAYASSTLGYSLKYPDGFTLNEAYRYEFNDEKSIAGVKLTIPMSMATGTNLAADSGVSLEQLPRAQKCTGDIFLRADVRASLVTEGGVAYSVASSSDSGAGNMYEEIVYALPSSSPCTALRYFIHSTSLSNYEPGMVRAFDKSNLLKEFNALRASLTPLSRGSAATSTGATTTAR
jgi:hypothetical protein